MTLNIGSRKQEYLLFLVDHLQEARVHYSTATTPLPVCSLGSGCNPLERSLVQVTLIGEESSRSSQFHASCYDRLLADYQRRN